MLHRVVLISCFAERYPWSSSRLPGFQKLDPSGLKSRTDRLCGAQVKPTLAGFEAAYRCERNPGSLAQLPDAEAQRCTSHSHLFWGHSTILYAKTVTVLLTWG